MAANKKVPAIRFKGFEEEWECKILENVAQFFRGKLLSWKDIVNEGKYGCILYGNLYTEYGMIIRDVVYRTNMVNDELIYSRYGDVLIPSSDTTPTGLARASSIEKNNIILGGDINVIRPYSSLNGSYLSLSINSNKHKLIKLIKGSTVRHLDNSDIKKIELSISESITEQTQIGNYFKELDDLIQLQELKLEKVINLKKAMLEKMFPGANTDVPEIRFKGFNEKWNEFSIKKLCSISTGKSNTQDRKAEGRFPFYVRSPIIEKSNRFLFDEEAVLTVGDGVGTGKVFHYVNGKYDLHQRVYRMFDFQEVSAKYFYYIFSKNFHKRVMAMTAKTSVDSVRLEMISEMKVKVPHIEEQKSIVNYLDNLNQLINQSQQKITQLKHLKQALLQKMFI